MMMLIAVKKAPELPVAMVAQLANHSNKFFFFLAISAIYFYLLGWGNAYNNKAPLQQM
jgi:hypothetical protein